MSRLYFITHPEVVVDPLTPIERWNLSPSGIERMRRFARLPELANITAVWASSETKAIEAAGILSGALGLGVQVCNALGENDRSATGFLPPSEFESVADAFFAEPEQSIRGWERAVDVQARIRSAVDHVLGNHADGDLAVVAHGAVGTLLWCALSNRCISRAFDQPFQGHYWKADLADLAPLNGWEAIAPRI